MKAAIIAPANTMYTLPFAIREFGINNMRALGYEVIFGKNADNRFYHTAGTIEERLHDLNWALEDLEIDLILPVFGGYNSNQLLSKVDFTQLEHSKKRIMGFSDTTTLLCGFTNLSSLEVYHGPSFSVFCDPNLFDYTRRNCSAVLKGETVVYQDPSFSAEDFWYLKPKYGPREMIQGKSWKTYQEGEVIGKVVGGNVETLSSLAGTVYFPDVDGKILILEEGFSDNPASFHRSMTQFYQMGVFDRITGLILGKPPQKSLLSDSAILEVILDEVIKNDKLPIMHSIHCSHVDPMLTLPFHTLTRLVADENPKIIANFKYKTSFTTFKG